MGERERERERERGEGGGGRGGERPPGGREGVRAPTRGEMKELERPAPDQSRIPKLSVALRLCRSPR